MALISLIRQYWEQSYDVQIKLQPDDLIQPCVGTNNSASLVGDDLIYRHGFEATSLNL
jgi:hypothetical protein